MSTPWPMAQLERVLKHRKEFIEIDDLQTYKRCRVQLHAQGILLRDTVSGSEIKTKKQQVCRAGEFLVAEIDAKVGGFGVVPDDLDGAIVSSHYFLFELDAILLDRKFLNYFVRTPAFRDQVLAQGSTNYAAIRPSDVLGYKIPLPPLSEQQRIMTRIEELAAKIKEARGLRGQTVNEARVLWEGGAAAVFDSAAERYPLRTLNTLVAVRGGGTPPKWNPSYWEGSIPWITPKDMKVRELWDSIDKISERATQETAAKLIAPGAVLVVVRGMILAHTFPSAVLRVKAAINQDMKALVPNEELTPDYLGTILWAYNSRTLEMVEKSTHDTRKLDTEKLLDTKIPVPPTPEQRRIVAKLDSLHMQVNSLKHQQTETAYELEALLPAVLDKAFKGEL